MSGANFAGHRHTKTSKRRIGLSCKRTLARPSVRKRISDGTKKGIVNRNDNAAWRLSRIGKNNPNWKGGVTVKIRGLRRSYEYKLWRRAVLERDGHTCIWCGSCTRLQADHIKSFSRYPELRFAIDNGRTLCEPCHKTTKTYGKG